MAQKNTNNKEKTKEQKTDKNDFIRAVGRRKEAVARVRLYPQEQSEVMVGDAVLKKGEIFVNGKSIQEYFPSEIAKIAYTEPFRITNTLASLIITVKVVGGGKEGQLDAVVHGISRALVKYDKEKFRPILKKKGLLTRDSRIRERRKVGMGGKARRKKQSPKR